MIYAKIYLGAIVISYADCFKESRGWTQLEEGFTALPRDRDNLLDRHRCKALLSSKLPPTKIHLPIGFRY